MRLITCADNGDPIILASDIEKIFGFDWNEICYFIDIGILPKYSSISVEGWRRKDLITRLYDIKEAREKFLKI